MHVYVYVYVCACACAGRAPACVCMCMCMCMCVHVHVQAVHREDACEEELDDVEQRLDALERLWRCLLVVSSGHHRREESRVEASSRLVDLHTARQHDRASLRTCELWRRLEKRTKPDDRGADLA